MSQPEAKDILDIVAKNTSKDLTCAYFGDRALVIYTCDDVELELIAYWMAIRLGAQFVDLYVVGEISHELRKIDAMYGNVTRWVIDESSIANIESCIRINPDLAALAQEAEIF